MTTQSSPSDFEIRRATVQDVEAVSRHRSQMWLAMKDISPESYDSMYRQSQDYFREAIPAGTYIGWVLVPLRAQETIAGGGGLLLRCIPPFPDSQGGVCPSDKQAHILNVYVEEEYRRLGLAKYLMETILDWCRQEGVGSVTLNASSVGKPLYEQLNFTEVRNFMKWKME
ncbi:GNAT family N-acetyltransferase [Telluribacter sp.]|uniref:GNAT family N-acetyltransferase n=1 Tax=Telluribacter sp. TaxID=1978767 RepID=UPI002E12C795|nr:GNAT family N-acetyltransferase [Telluribacter sp.]